MRRLVLMGLVLVGVAGASEAFAQTAALSLSLPPTARANGMGQAYVALADDATATWWNPAGMGFLTTKDASLTYAKLVPDLADDVFFMFPTYTMPIKNVGTFGASLVYLSYGTSQATSSTGEDLGTFTSYEIAPTLSYGTTVAKTVGLGASFKYVRVQLSPDITGLGEGKGSTVAFDLGALYKYKDIANVGVTMQNLGPSISFIADSRKDPIYRNLKTGIAVNAYKHKQIGVLLVGDLNHLMVKGETENPDGTTSGSYPRPIGNYGAEVSYTTEVAVALRAGRINDPDGSIQDWTFGFGIGYHAIKFDYSSIPQANDSETGNSLARVSKFSLGARF
jgi:hypothetical protein